MNIDRYAGHARGFGLSLSEVYRSIERAALWQAVRRFLDRLPLTLVAVVVLVLVVLPFILRRVRGAPRRTAEGGSTRGGGRRR